MQQPPDLQEVSVPPPPPSGPPAMDEAAFARLAAAVKKESFSENQVTIIQTAAAAKPLPRRPGQDAARANRIFGLEAARPRDGRPSPDRPQNSFELYDSFSFSADKDRARQILKRNGQSK